MAKENYTAMEQMIEWYEKEFPILDFDNPSILHKMQDLRSKERQQIESAYTQGGISAYMDADHYFFMEYIDND